MQPKGAIELETVTKVVRALDGVGLTLESQYRNWALRAATQGERDAWAEVLQGAIAAIPAKQHGEHHALFLSDFVPTSP